MLECAPIDFTAHGMVQDVEPEHHKPFGADPGAWFPACRAAEADKDHGLILVLAPFFFLMFSMRSPEDDQASVRAPQEEPSFSHLLHEGAQTEAWSSSELLMEKTRKRKRGDETETKFCPHFVS